MYLLFSNFHFSICSDIQVMYQNLAKVVTQKARDKAIEKFKLEFEVEECLLDAAWDRDNDVVIYNETHPNHIINPWKVYLVQYTVQSRFSDILFSDKSRFSDNFAEDHFFST